MYLMNKVLFLLQSFIYSTSGHILPSITVCPAVDKFENDTTSVNVAELPGVEKLVFLVTGVLSVTLKPIPILTTSGSSWWHCRPVSR
jgi:hypothetical protein